MHLINLLSTLLRCNGFAGMQKAVADQMGSSPPVTMTFLGASLALESVLKLLFSPIVETVVTDCHLKSTFHHMSQSDREMVPCCTD